MKYWHGQWISDGVSVDQIFLCDSPILNAFYRMICSEREEFGVKVVSSIGRRLAYLGNRGHASSTPARSRLTAHRSRSMLCQHRLISGSAKLEGDWGAGAPYVNIARFGSYRLYLR
jgi:hypothetical protein